MISPYKKIRDFMVTVNVDGKSLELQEVSDKVREIFPVRYNIDFDGSILKIEGKARLDFFRPSAPKEAEQFSLIAEADDGKLLFQYLEDQKLASTLGLSRSKSKQWFVEFRKEVDLQELDKVESDPNKVENNPDNDIIAIANPGPFAGEVDSFDLGAASFQQQSVFDRINEYRQHVKNLSGIRVYRDGFAIRVDRDWLKLGAQWTSAPSYYGLKPDTTLGYIALSARDNINLEETTDREGFKDSPYYRNFYLLLTEFINFTTKSHEFFGKSLVRFSKEKKRGTSAYRLS